MKWLLRLLGFKSNAEVWRDCVYAEARSRGMDVEPVVRNGFIYAYDVSDPTGRLPTIRVGACK